MTAFLSALPRRTFLVLMLLGAGLITLSSLPYLDFSELPPFVIEKLPVRFERLWLWSLRGHVVAAILTFPACLLLMTRWLQRRGAYHRWIGRVTGGMVLFVLVPTGAVLSFEAKGGAWVTVGFLLSGAIVAWGIVRGVGAARRRDYVAHRRATRHVVAQMSVAVTSRAMIVGMDAYGADPDFAYVAALWVPVIGSALIAELASRRSLFGGVYSLMERIRREDTVLAPPVRSGSAGIPFARPQR